MTLFYVKISKTLSAQYCQENKERLPKKAWEFRKFF